MKQTGSRIEKARAASQTRNKYTNTNVTTDLASRKIRIFNSITTEYLICDKEEVFTPVCPLKAKPVAFAGAQLDGSRAPAEHAEKPKPNDQKCWELMCLSLRATSLSKQRPQSVEDLAAIRVLQNYKVWCSARCYHLFGFGLMSHSSRARIARIRVECSTFEFIPWTAPKNGRTESKCYTFRQKIKIIGTVAAEPCQSQHFPTPTSFWRSVW